MIDPNRWASDNNVGNPSGEFLAGMGLLILVIWFAWDYL